MGTPRSRLGCPGMKLVYVSGSSFLGSPRKTAATALYCPARYIRPVIKCIQSHIFVGLCKSERDAFTSLFIAILYAVFMLQMRCHIDPNEHDHGETIENQPRKHDPCPAKKLHGGHRRSSWLLVVRSPWIEFRCTHQHHILLCVVLLSACYIHPEKWKGAPGVGAPSKSRRIGVTVVGRDRPPEFSPSRSNTSAS